MRHLLWLALPLLVGGCAALKDDMRRAETAFDEARYENVQVWLSGLDEDVADMDRDMRARYYYLRGVSAYRLGDMKGARHYLALCRQEAGEEGNGLRADWRNNVPKILDEVDPISGSGKSADGEERPPPVQP